MRIYGGLLEAHSEIQRDLFEVGEWVSGETVQDKQVGGDPDFDFMELRPYVYTLTQWEDWDAFMDQLKLSRGWVFSEHGERINPARCNPGSAWWIREDVWEEFLQTNGCFSYTYNERFRLKDQLNRIIEELVERRQTRQAVLTIFNPLLDMEKLGGFQRVPCSLNYQFLIRNEHLELIYSMRSCDFFVHFPYDQLLALLLLEHLGECVLRPPSRFTHVIGSLHGFRKDFPEDIF